MKTKHLFELAMHPTALNAMGKHLADKIKVGYEFEFAIVPGTSLYPSEQASHMNSIKITTIDSMKEFKDVFHISSKQEEKITDDYYDEIAPMIHKYADKNWKEYNDNYEDGYDSASQDYLSSKPAYSIDDYIKDNIEDIISKYALEPMYGWTDENHLYVFTGEGRDEYDEIIKITKDNIKQSLQNTFPGTNIVVSDSAPVEQWRVMIDTSISSIKDSVGIEIATSPYPLHEALAVLQKMFDWMNHYKVITNKTTGLHINISIVGDPNQVDVVKLALFLGEKYSMKQFDRVASKYAKSQYDRLVKATTEEIVPGEHELSNKNIEKIIQLLKTSISTEKYFSFNINNLKDKGYIEFRIPGNANYHTEHEKARDTTLRYAIALSIASDENAHKQEYYKKIAQLFTKSLQSVGWNQQEQQLPIDWKYVEKMNYLPRFRLAFRGFRNSVEHEKTAAVHFIVQLLITIYEHVDNITTNDVIFVMSLIRLSKSNKKTIADTLKRTAKTISPKLSMTDIANIINEFKLQ